MSRKKKSAAGDRPVATDPSGDLNNDEATDLASEKASESYDDSLEAILLQAGARPPETASAKMLGSKTLMGIGIESLNLAGLRPTPETKAPAPSDAGSPSGDLTPTVEAKVLASASADSQVSSLLDEVAQALNVQASEYRDRARGKLPGMPGAAAAAAATAAPPASALSNSDDLEFEDPDEPTVLTPGVISVLEDGEHEELDLDASAEDSTDDDEAVVLGPAGGNKSPAGGTESRPSRLPPIPGLSGPTAASFVPPPPGAARSPTPSSGLSLPPSGRVRLPTPAPGMPTVPPPSGRLSLPPGMMSAPVIPGPQPTSMGMGIDLTATAPSTPMSLEASRRVSAPMATPGSGRTTKTGSGRVTQPVIHSTPSMPNMPTVLAAQVKIATLSLAGLIAVTFAGGLLVGMLVWRGQGRPEPMRAAGEPAGAVPAAGEAPPAPTTAGTATAGHPTAAGALAGSAPGVPTTGNAMPTAAGAGTPTEAIVTPIAAEAADTAPKAPPRRAVALRQPPRAKRPAATPTIADTAALFPKSTGAGAAGAANAKPAIARPAAPAASSAPKTVASNAPAKTAPKSKSKTTWHDPFAD